LAVFGTGVNVDFTPLLGKLDLLVSAMNHGGSVRHNVDGRLAYSRSGEAYADIPQMTGDRRER